jgi:hypothetical protein
VEGAYRPKAVDGMAGLSASKPTLDLARSKKRARNTAHERHALRGHDEGMLAARLKSTLSALRKARTPVCD